MKRPTIAVFLALILFPSCSLLRKNKSQQNKVIHIAEQVVKLDSTTASSRDSSTKAADVSGTTTKEVFYSKETTVEKYDTAGKLTEKTTIREKADKKVNKETQSRTTETVAHQSQTKAVSATTQTKQVNVQEQSKEKLMSRTKALTGLGWLILLAAIIGLAIWQVKKKLPFKFYPF